MVLDLGFSSISAVRLYAPVIKEAEVAFCFLVVCLYMHA